MSNPEEPAGREVTLYGRRLSSIPCFRQTYLYGIGSGIVGGLTYFMLTSRPRTASHVAFGTFVTATVTYWFYCRYTFATASFQHRQLQYAMKQQIMTEGTEADPSTAGQEPKKGSEIASV